jgi:O-antigen/teichoic acid export membrane protein
MNRTAGIIMIVVGAVLGLVAAAWLFSNPDLTAPARILGLGLALLVLVVPLVGYTSRYRARATRRYKPKRCNSVNC